MAAASAVQFNPAEFDAAVADIEKWPREQIIAEAKAAHSRVMNTPPRPVFFQRFVDGVLGAPESAVKDNGIIYYLYPRLDLVVQEAMDVLFTLSPVDSGIYRRSHTIFVNGQPAANVQDWQPEGEIIITNPVPYARKIEIGAMQMKVPGTDHVYSQAARLVRRQYGYLANIGFTYRLITGVQSANVLRARDRKHTTSDMRYPVLVITEKG